MKTFRLVRGRSLRALLWSSLSLVSAAGVGAATRTWDGGGDGVTWSQAANWSGDIAPVSGDDAVIPSGLATTVLVTASTTVAGLQADSPLRVDVGTLTVTGTARINALFTLDPGTTLTASGASADVIVAGSTALNGGSLIATGGARLEVASLASYDTAATSGATYVLRATGAGSELALPALTEVVNGFASGDTDARDVELTIEALAGGRIDAPLLTTLRDAATGTHSGSQINLRADGAGSLINANGLVSVLDRDLASWFSSGVSAVTATNGGTLNAPVLATLRGVTLTIDATGTFPVSAPVSFTYGTITTTGATRIFTQLADGTGSSFVVSGGGRLELPALTAYKRGRDRCDLRLPLPRDRLGQRARAPRR